MKSILTTTAAAVVFAAEGAGSAAPAKTEAPAVKTSGFKLKLLREAKAEEKFGPQQQAIYDQMKKYGVGKEVDRATVLADLEKSGAIKTRQPVDRILAYYLNPFKKMGIVDSIAPPKAEKPAKEPKPAKDKSPANAEAKPAK